MSLLVLTFWRMPLSCVWNSDLGNNHDRQIFCGWRSATSHQTSQRWWRASRRTENPWFWSKAILCTGERGPKFHRCRRETYIVRAPEHRVWMWIVHVNSWLRCAGKFQFKTSSIWRVYNFDGKSRIGTGWYLSTEWNFSRISTRRSIFEWTWTPWSRERDPHPTMYDMTLQRGDVCTASAGTEIAITHVIVAEMMEAICRFTCINDCLETESYRISVSTAYWRCRAEW